MKIDEKRLRRASGAVPFGRFPFGMFILLDGAAILEKDFEPFSQGLDMAEEVGNEATHTDLGGV